MKVGPVKVIGEWRPYPEGDGGDLRLTLTGQMVPQGIFGEPELRGIIPMGGETVILLRQAQDHDDYTNVEHLRAVLGVASEF